MATNDALFPSGLTNDQSALLASLAASIDPTTPEVYLQEAKLHLNDVATAKKANPEINIRLANALYASFEAVIAMWAQIPEHSLKFLCAAMRYFASDLDEMHDYTSFVGFEDDTEVMNACLELAGLADFQIDPAHYDDDEAVGA